MRNTIKKYLALLLIAVMAASALGGFLADGAAVSQVKAAGNPEYMMKLVPGGGAVSNPFAFEKGETYTLTCNYYAQTSNMAATELTSVIFTTDTWQSVGAGEYDGRNAGAEKNKVQSLTVKYKTGDNNNWMGIRFSNNSADTTFYFWNIKICKGDGKVNILDNADFTSTNGSWFHWQLANYNGGEFIDTAEKSQAATEKTGNTIIPYDTSIGGDNTELPDYSWDGTAKRVTISNDVNLDLNQTITRYHLWQEGKIFIGWKDQDGNTLTADQVNGYDFKEGDVLTAQYMDYDPKAGGDFAIRSEEIRTEGKLGLRFIVEMSNQLVNNLPGAGEYGTIVLPSEILNANTWAELTYDGKYTYNGATYKTAVVKGTNTYQVLDDRIYYTLCITDLTAEKYDRQYTVKGYLKYTDLNGTEQILYTDYASTEPYLISKDTLKDTEVNSEKKAILENMTQTVEAKWKEERAAMETGAADFVGTSADPTGWMYQLTNGIRVREAAFDSGKGGDPVEIIQLSDFHYNYINDLDRAEANPTLMSTYEKRTWLANGGSVKLSRTLLEYARTADQVVLTGDVMDYLSHGAAELMYREVWDKYPDTIIAVGNHEYVQQMQGTVAESLTGDARWQWLKNIWRHDPYYTSKVVGDKAMVIQMSNGEGKFYESQYAKLKADIETARTNGYVVLLFMHEPLSTGNASDANAMAIYKGDSASADFYNYKQGHIIHPDHDTTGIYNLITSNADVIKGIFNGHVHSSYYTEISAKTSTGESTVIPQYTLTSSIYDTGYALKITVK